jgi:zinc protease
LPDNLTQSFPKKGSNSSFFDQKTFLFISTACIFLLMKKRHKLSIAILFGFYIAVLPLNASFFPYLMYEKELPNHMRIVVVPIRDARTVSFATLVRTGSRNETDEGYTGYAHLLEHMMFRGSENYSTEDRVNLLYRYGGDSNAFTSMDYTCYTVSCDPAGLEEVLALEADRLMRLSLKKEDFKAETGAVIGEFGISEKYPSNRMDNALRGCMFQGHTYEHSVIGYREDVMNMPEGYKYIREFYIKEYRPDKTIMFIAGKIDKPGEVLSKAGDLFSGWTYKPAPLPTIRPSLKPVSCRDTLYDATIPAPRVKIAWKIPGYAQDCLGHIAARILAEHYFSDNSPLMMKLRDEKKWISSGTYNVPLTIDPYWISLDLVLTEEGVGAAIGDYVLGILQDSRYTLKAGELESLKKRQFYKTHMQLSSPSSILGVLADYAHIKGDPHEINHYFLTLERLEILDVRLCKEKYLTRRNQSELWMFAR